MTFEPLDSRMYRIEDELNRLAGTMVGGMPTLGKATAALWWLGHRELAWASHNMLTPNQATGGKALKDGTGFTPLDGQLLEVVEGDAMLGNECLRITPNSAQATGISAEHEYQRSALVTTDPIPVETWNIYTASMYTRMAPGADTPSRANWMSLIWLDAEGNEVGRHDGDFHVSKQEWNLTWVETYAPEGVTYAQVQIRWDIGKDEVFFIDKAILYNGTDPQAWAFPGAGGFDLDAGLRAHLNMKAGIFNPDEFLSIDDVANRLGSTRDATAGMALSVIPTPNLLSVQH